MHNLKRLAALVAVLLSVGSAVGGPPRKNVVAAVPDDAAFAFIIPDLDALVAQVAAFGKAIKNDDMAGATVEKILADSPMGAAGIDTKGSIILAMAPESGDSPIIVVSLKDAEAWKKGVGATDSSGILKISNGGRDGFAAIKGDVAVIAENEDLIKSAAKADGKFAALLKPFDAEIDKNAMFLFVNVPPWKETIEQSLGMMEGLMLMMASSPEAAGATGMLKFGMGELRALIGDAESVTLGANLSGDAIHAAIGLGMKSGSKSAEKLAKTQAGGKSLFRGHPDRPFAMAFGSEWQGESGGPSLVERMLQAIAETAPGAEKSKIEASLKQVAGFMGKVTGMSGTLRGAGDKGMLLSFGYLSADAKSLHKSCVQMIEASTDLSSAMAPGMKVEVTKGEEKIGGADATVINLKYAASDPAAMAAITQFYGGDTVTNIMTVSDDIVLGVAGNNDAVRADIAKPAGKLAENARVGAALKALSAKPMGVCLIDLAQGMEMARSMMGPAGAGIPKLGSSAASAPLIGMAFYTSPGSFRLEAHVPTAPIRAIVDAGDAPEPAAGESKGGTN